MVKVLLWTQYVLLVGILVLAIQMLWRNYQAKTRQDQLVEGLRGLRYWRVNLVRDSYYRGWLRLMPFESKGVLIDDGASVRVQGWWPKEQEPFEYHFDKSQSPVKWLGKPSFKSGHFCWARLGNAQGALMFASDSGRTPQASREALADIFRSAFPDQRSSSEHDKYFALEKNPRSLTLLQAMLGLGLACLFNEFLSAVRLELTDDQLLRIVSSPWTMVLTLVLGGAIATGLYRYLRRGRVPSAESVVLTTLMCLVLLATVFATAKRVDQLLAPSPAQNYAYRIKSAGELEPVDTTLGLPMLHFSQSREYWEQFAVGSEYQIPFIHGPLGLWLLDHSLLDPPLRNFYERRHAAPGSAPDSAPRSPKT